MPTNNPDPDAASLRPPSSGELVLLAILWEAMAKGAKALRVSEVRELLIARNGQAPEASTISTQLRSLLEKEWLEELIVSQGVVRTRGTIETAGTPTRTRSPFTAYRPRFSASDALLPTLRQLADSYPKSERHKFLDDAARALAEVERIGVSS